MPKPKNRSATKRALLCWELGRNLGHVSNLLAVAERLKTEGWETVYTGPNLENLPDRCREIVDHIVPSPHLYRTRPAQDFVAGNFSDVLAIRGFDRADTLMAHLLAWDGLIHFVEPDVIIGDYAPFLALAAYGSVPFIAMGHSFYNPPSQLREFPLITQSPGAGVPEARLFSNVLEAQRRRGRPKPASFPESIAGDAQVVIDFPEFDLYARGRTETAAGPIIPLTGPLPPPLGEPSLFLYLGYDYPPTQKVIEAVLRSGVAAKAFLRNCPAEIRHRLRERGLDVSDTPVPMEEALRDCTGIIHHGGGGTLSQAASAGRPQLILADHLEHALNARMATYQEIAMVFGSQPDPADYLKTLKNFLSDSRIAGAAKALAGTLQERSPVYAMEQVLKKANEIAGY